MKQSDMVKLNDDELYELAAAYGSPYHSIEQNIGYLVELTRRQNPLRDFRQPWRGSV